MKNDYRNLDKSYFNKSDLLKNLLDYQEFILNDIEAKIIVGKKKDSIIIKTDKFAIEVNIKELSTLFDKVFKNINDSYSYIINLFELNKISSLSTVNKEQLALIINDKEKNFQIILKKIDVNKDSNNIDAIKENDIKLLNNSKSGFPNINLFPINLLDDTYGCPIVDNSFLVFKSFNDINYLIYSNKEKSIKAYDLLTNKNLTEIKNAHNYFIDSFRHFLDKKNKRDLFLSVSSKDRNLKVWNLRDFQCLFDIKDIYKYGKMYTACFVDDKNNIYLIPGIYKYKFRNENKKELLKVFNLEGNVIKEIKNSFKQILSIDSYFDKTLSKNYIVIGSRGGAVSYDFDNNECYHVYEKYFWVYKNYNSYSIIIYAKENVVKLINSLEYGVIGIWNFHTGQLLNNIIITDDMFYGICLMDNRYILVGFQNGIKIFDFLKGIAILSFETNYKKVNTIKKIIHPLYGECFISRADNEIKLWTFPYK